MDIFPSGKLACRQKSTFSMSEQGVTGQDRSKQFDFDLIVIKTLKSLFDFVSICLTLFNLCSYAQMLCLFA